MSSGPDGSVLPPPLPTGVVDAGAPEAEAGPVRDQRPPVRATRFASRVVSVELGPCGGFGNASMPQVVLGPPEGYGELAGSLDVLSLGVGGSITLSFEANPIIDGPGADFIVFENAFFAGGDRTQPFVEPGEVRVSDDGVTWQTFACDATRAPYTGCAGVTPVYSASNTDRSAVDPKVAGGDVFDLASVGLMRARFVQIVDRGAGTCTPPLTNVGFDLDAVASIHAEIP
jgi:hypothetical protein